VRKGDLHLGEKPRVLDFGCGCARVLDALGRSWPAGELVGVDVDAEAIAWCQAHLASTASFVHGPDEPPLPFASGSFDLVYAVSVFTHLSPARQEVWLDELLRVLAPGGTAIITIYGSRVSMSLNAKARRALQQGSRRGRLIGYQEHAVMGALDAVLVAPAAGGSR
jgi:SAM-dependent methyltransferase